MEDEERDFPVMRGIHSGLPEGVSVDIKQFYDECCYETEYAGEKHLYAPTVHWFSYADMYIYCLEHPEVPDYEAMDELYCNEEENESVKKVIMKSTPMKALKKRVDAFLEVMDDWDWQNDFSLIRIVYWIE